jgi:membrane protease YdiL (CAAX protease family)
MSGEIGRPTRTASTAHQDGRLGVIGRAVLVGMLVMLAGTIPRNLVFAANLRYGPSVPWAVPLIAVYLWLFWRYLGGAGSPVSTAEERRASLRANRVSGHVWAWALLAGGLGIVALVLALRVANRLVVLPRQQLPDLARLPKLTVVSLLLMAAPVAGFVEEAAFRGYMQGPIERRHGPALAIVVTGTMFALAHLDFTAILWPYYVAVAAIYGTVTYLTDSILPAVALHTSGNVYSNLDLWLHGQAEWQAPSGPATLVWTTGVDVSFRTAVIALLAVAATTVLAFVGLSRVVRRSPQAASTPAS